MQQRFAGAAGLAHFSEAVRGSLVDQVLRAPAPERFRADLVDVSVGGVALVSAEVGPLQSRRDDDGAAAGSVFLLLAQRGTGSITHRGGTEAIGPHRLVVVPAGEGFAVDYPGPASLLFVALPAAHVTARCPALDGPVRAVPLQRAARAVAGQLPYVLSAALDAQGSETEDLAGLLESVLHLVLRGALGDLAGDPLVALRLAAERTAERHLDDPALSVAWLARQLSVSVRQLHRAFTTGGATPGEHLRRQRLQACARVLAESPGTGVADLASRFGFASASHLGARFRAVYGETPGSWRARHAADRHRSVC
ncbi:AraC family transcriptional regulator [Blastococcus tunisiensis]|uniref:AraC-type DNA-binding protein n=1 Tax=Blastococcus tunisiensis TaxID=1798228 RepID=A0A1I2FAC3_9ACTN|nr:AraC family transcriptional regulator [Blastococcus sp. DSM 46838]SFF01708.1 AraC-type DNA-binding protein [Blastococcus sp. DSM 46838]